jgi:hypothetical protein
MKKPQQIVFVFIASLSLNSCVTATSANQKPPPAFRITEKRTLSSIQNSQVEKFLNALEIQDASKGAGFKSADLFVADQKQPVLSPEYKQVLPNEAYISLGHMMIDGTPTRIFLDHDGKVAFIAFDEQAVRLLTPEFSNLPGHGVEKHGLGFSTALGKLKNFDQPLNTFSVAELRDKIGHEGQAVTLEYASGIKVIGTIEKFTTTKVDDQEIPVLISFKLGTCKVTYGIHTLFESKTSEFDLSLENEIKNSYLTSKKVALQNQ